MAKSRSYRIAFPLTPKNVRRSASRLEAHADRLKRELIEVQKLRIVLQASCPHLVSSQGVDMCLDCGLPLWAFGSPHGSY